MLLAPRGRKPSVSWLPMYEKLFDLTGRVALVTGGSRGLGKAMARAYAEHGASVMICSRNAAELEAAAREIGHGLTVRVEFMTADLGKRGEAQRVAEETLARITELQTDAADRETAAAILADEKSGASLRAKLSEAGIAGPEPHTADAVLARLRARMAGDSSAPN